MSRPTLTHASASPLVAALAEADGSPSPSPPGAVVVAVPLSHAYSGPTPSPMGGSGKHAAGAKGPLSRYSYAGSVRAAECLPILRGGWGVQGRDRMRHAPFPLSVVLLAEAAAY